MGCLNVDHKSVLDSEDLKFGAINSPFEVWRASHKQRGLDFGSLIFCLAWSAILVSEKKAIVVNWGKQCTSIKLDRVAGEEYCPYGISMYSKSCIYPYLALAGTSIKGHLEVAVDYASLQKHPAPTSPLSHILQKLSNILTHISRPNLPCLEQDFGSSA